jgi:hypothetical protein
VLIVATPVAVDDHVAVLVRSCVLPSLYVPVAVNWSVPPVARERFGGVTAMDSKEGSSPPPAA